MEAENAKTEHSVWEVGEVIMREVFIEDVPVSWFLKGNLIEVLAKQEG